MKIKKTAYKTTLLFAFLTTLFSCNGQKAAENNIGRFGKVVSELDKSIWSIYQDKKGNYWFGSNGNGVFFYDGKTITNFTDKDGIAGNQIRGIQGDTSGNVYFDTPNGITKYDGLAFNTLIAFETPNNAWKAGPDDLWFKGSGDPNGVYRYDGQSLYFLKFPEHDLEKTYGIRLEPEPYSPFGVYGIYKDSKNALWFGTLSAGVFHFAGGSLNWIAEKELIVLEDGRVPGVRSIIEDKDGNFWLSNILNRYRIRESASGSFNYEKLDGIKPLEGQSTMNFPYFMSAVTDNKNQDLWITTYSEGVWRYDGDGFFHYPVKDGAIDVLLYSMYKDNKGTIWLGTHNAGAYKLTGEKFEKFNP